MNGASARLTDTEVISTVSDSLRRAYNGNIKRVANDADARIDTAKNWLEGRNLPGLGNFFRLARNCPELRAEAMRLMAPEAEFEADFMRDVLRAMQTLSRLRNPP